MVHSLPMKKLGLTVLLLSLIGCSPTVYNEGVPNFYQVASDGSVWRSGQPTTVSQCETIKSKGIKHIYKLNFESEGSSAPCITVGLDVQVYSIQPEGDKSIFDQVTNTFVMPDWSKLVDVEQKLELCTPTNACLVQCTHGQDRTGTEILLYRTQHDHWSKADAYAEALKYNFHPALHGLHETVEMYDPSKWPYLQ